MNKPLRRAGAVWRLLVHRHSTDGPQSDMAHHVQSDRVKDRAYTEFSQTTVLPRTELDELVVGRWLHLEQMDTGFWWMAIGGVVVHVWADRDGRPTTVTVHGPGAWDDPVEGCSYELDWPGESTQGGSDRHGPGGPQ